MKKKKYWHNLWKESAKGNRLRMKILNSTQRNKKKMKKICLYFSLFLYHCDGGNWLMAPERMSHVWKEPKKHVTCKAQQFKQKKTTNKCDHEKSLPMQKLCCQIASLARENQTKASYSMQKYTCVRTLFPFLS